MSKIKVENYQVGKIVRAASARVEGAKTEPPSYYTEASLLEDMCNAHKFAQNAADSAALKSTNGIGTARTRGEVIKDLINSKCLAREGKGKKQILKDTSYGRALTSIAPAALKSVTMTAKWEVLFSNIEKGAVTPEQFLVAIHKFCTAIVEQARQVKDNPVRA